ncbi:hypothetical protein BDD12DRAFT_803445 [Trichophaea hybrida]|nr:hypothetical protein BDD12DRAFT_803445 [Trichophaea hybrida]
MEPPHLLNFPSNNGLEVILSNNDMGGLTPGDGPGISGQTCIQAVPQPYVSLPMLENSISILPSVDSNTQFIDDFSCIITLPEQPMGYFCPVCGHQELEENFDKFVSHLEIHCNVDFGAACPVDKCSTYWTEISALLQHMRVEGHSITYPADECQYSISPSLLKRYFRRRLPQTVLIEDSIPPTMQLPYVLAIPLPRKFETSIPGRFSALCPNCLADVELYWIWQGKESSVWSAEEDFLLQNPHHNNSAFTKLVDGRTDIQITTRIRNLQEGGNLFRQSALWGAFVMWLLHVVGNQLLLEHPPGELSPMMERYLSSSSEDEAAALEDILEEANHYRKRFFPGDLENRR